MNLGILVERPRPAKQSEAEEPRSGRSQGYDDEYLVKRSQAYRNASPPQYGDTHAYNRHPPTALSRDDHGHSSKYDDRYKESREYPKQSRGKGYESPTRHTSKSSHSYVRDERIERYVEQVKTPPPPSMSPTRNKERAEEQASFGRPPPRQSREYDYGDPFPRYESRDPQPEKSNRDPRYSKIDFIEFMMKSKGNFHYF